MIFRFCTSLLWVGIFSSSSAVLAQEPSSGQTLTKTYEQLQQEIKRLRESEEVRNVVLKNLIRRIEQLESTVANAQLASENSPSAPGNTTAKPVLSQEQQKRILKEREENYQIIASAFEQRLGRQGGMLLAPYRLTYEPSFSYMHSSYDAIVVDGFTVYPVLVVGEIVAEKIRRDVFTNNHSFRLGLPGDYQLDLVIPVGYEKVRSFRDDGTFVKNNTEGVGDVSLSLSHQLISQSESWPDTAIGISWRFNTGSDPYEQVSADVPSLGTGFETWGLSMTSIVAADPMVLFWGSSVSYTPDLEKNIGRIKPGESFGVNLGMALSLNLNTSVSGSFNLHRTLETEVDGQAIQGSDLTTSTFSIGLSRAKSDTRAMDFGLAIGLTQDAPDFQVSVSFPFEFSLE